MATNLARQGQQLARKVLLFQLTTVVVMCALSLVFFEAKISLAIFAGGLMSIVPNSVFAALAFRYSGATKNQMVVRSFAQGAKLKLILTVIFGVLAFKGLNLAPLALFIGFIVTTISQWFGMVSVTDNKE